MLCILYTFRKGRLRRSTPLSLSLSGEEEEEEYGSLSFPVGGRGAREKTDVSTTPSPRLSQPYNNSSSTILGAV